MDKITLRDIEAIARLESAKMQHFYIGVEHLFIALTKLDDGLTAAVFEQMGQSVRYKRYITREMLPHGDDRRYWPGYRTTPRAEQVMARAQALIESGISPDERALLIAILEEGDSIPVRTMREAGMDIAELCKLVLDWSGGMRAQAPSVTIVDGEDLSADEQVVLRLMFQKYDTIRVERIFQEGYSGSTVLLVRPLHADKRSDALVVVKIAERGAILWEKKRYDSFVKDTLPPATARIESDPVLPDHSQLGGLKYTFVRLRGADSPVNLYEYSRTHTAAQVAIFLREALFNGFLGAWWGQAQPYKFTTWQEYDFLMPPALIVEALPPESVPETARPLRPLDDWSRNGTVRPGEVVVLENFTAQKMKKASGVLQLVAGGAPEAINRASRVDVQGLDFSQHAYFRGEVIREMGGRVLQTREDLLQQQVQALEPAFNILDDYLPYRLNASERLPNPLRHYNAMLDKHLSGTLSTIHGDLHTGNVLIGPGGDAWLIDFEWTRDGHTLFDWAVLEVSLLVDFVLPVVGSSWDEAWHAIRLLEPLNRTGQMDSTDQAVLVEAFRPIVEVRRIAGELLATRGQWAEYQVALALVALRVISWTNRTLGARRLAFLASALAMNATRTRGHGGQSQTVGDLTDMTTDLNESE